jgi:Tfp pilus assembly protein PilF
VTPAAPAFTGPISFEEAESAYRDKRFEDAFGMFAVYVDERPENAWGHYMKGLAAWKAGRLTEAEGALIRALEIDPAHQKGLVNLARVYLEMDRPADALTQVKQALVLAPSTGSAHRVAGRVHAELGEVDAAIEAYRQALASDDHDAWAMNNLGLILIQQGRFEDALLPLARAVELREDVAVIHNNLGIALERSGYPGMAAEVYGKTLEIDSSYAKAETNLARVTTRIVAAVEEDLDLAFLAQLFVSDMARWGEESNTLVEVEPAVNDVEEGSVEQPLEVDSAPSPAVHE